ncbi:MAG: TonB family protein [Novosphingobium sp.]
MRYLWVSIVAPVLVAGEADAKPSPVPIPRDFPATLPSPPPPMAPPPAPPPPPIYYPVAPPAPPTYQPYGRGPYPKGNPGNWVTTNDYPTRALREERQGTTRFRVTVGADGRVSDCEITQGSGSNDLDSATCLLIWRRARFNPAQDGAGNPTIGYYSNSVRWVIPEDYRPKPLTGTLTVSFVVAPDGRPSNCRIVRGGGELGDAYDVGPADCVTEQFNSGFTDAKGRKVARLVTVTSVVSLRDAPLEPVSEKPAVRPASSLEKAQLGYLAWGAPSLWDMALGTRPAAGTVVVHTLVGVDGSVSNCRVASSAGPVARVITPGTITCESQGYDDLYRDAEGVPMPKLLVLTATTTVTPLTSAAPRKAPVRAIRRKR